MVRQMPKQPDREEFTDEMLMAYVDGEMDVRDRERLSERLAQDAGLRERLDVFSTTDRSLGRHYDDVLNQPVPPHLLDLVRNADVKQRPAGLMQRIAARLRGDAGLFAAPRLGLAAASTTAALVVGIGLGTWLNSGPRAPSADRLALLSIEDNHLWAHGALEDALERVGSGESKSWEETPGEAGKIVPVLTFKDRAGQFCREYAVTASREASAVGIACRRDTGKWSIEIHTAQPADATGAAPFRPASGRGIERLNALMTEMSDGEPLTLDQEEAAIRNDWR